MWNGNLGVSLPGWTPCCLQGGYNVSEERNSSIVRVHRGDAFPPKRWPIAKKRRKSKFLSQWNPEISESVDKNYLRERKQMNKKTDISAQWGDLQLVPVTRTITSMKMRWARHVAWLCYRKQHGIFIVKLAEVEICYTRRGDYQLLTSCTPWGTSVS